MLGCIVAENAVGWAPDPCLAFNTLPPAPVCGLMNLNTLLCSLFWGVLSLGFLLWMKNIRFTVGADVFYVTVLPNTGARAFSQTAGPHAEGHTPCV